MSNGSFARRLERLERIHVVPSKRCPQCGNSPTRFVFQDPETGVEWLESMPPEGCTGCGRPPRSEIRFGWEFDPEMVEIPF